MILSKIRVLDLKHRNKTKRLRFRISFNWVVLEAHLWCVLRNWAFKMWDSFNGIRVTSNSQDLIGCWGFLYELCLRDHQLTALIWVLVCVCNNEIQVACLISLFLTQWDDWIINCNLLFKAMTLKIPLAFLSQNWLNLRSNHCVISLDLRTTWLSFRNCPLKTPFFRACRLCLCLWSGSNKADLSTLYLVHYRLKLLGFALIITFNFVFR